MNLKDLNRPPVIHRLAWFVTYSAAIITTLTALILAFWVHTLIQTNAELGRHAAYTIDSLRAEVVVHEVRDALFLDALTRGSREAGAVLRADK